MPSTEYEQRRQQQRAAAAQLVPEHVQRTYWPRDRILAEQERGLRRLLATARQSSPWHRERLAGVDLDRFCVADLAELPTMTKTELNEAFDAIVTDQRVNRELVERHLAHLGPQDDYLMEGYHAAVTGGSSGQRSVFVYDWDAWITWYLGLFRYIFRNPEAMTMRNADGGAPIVAGIGADTAEYGPTAVRQTFAGPEIRQLGISLFQPMTTVVETVNAARPDIVYSYPSVLRALAVERQDGRLQAEPRVLISTAEPLLPDTEEAVHKAWPQSQLVNWYATTEFGAVAVSCGQSPGMHLSEDYLIVEAVDADGRPVPPGTRSHKVYVTNLANTLLPIVRYEVSDQITLVEPESACPCGSAHARVASVDGRVEDSFWYSGGVYVHFTSFYTVLTVDPAVHTFQVHQTPAGARVLVRGQDSDLDALRERLVDQVSRSGLVQPEITVERVAELPRLGTSGKLKRFFPLPGKAG